MSKNKLEKKYVTKVLREFGAYDLDYTDILALTEELHEIWRSYHVEWPEIYTRGDYDNREYDNERHFTLQVIGKRPLTKTELVLERVREERKRQAAKELARETEDKEYDEYLKLKEKFQDREREWED